MSDLVARLREHASDDDGMTPRNPDGALLTEAADEIATLRADIARVPALETALLEAVEALETIAGWEETAPFAAETARATLAKIKDSSNAD